MIEAAEVMEVSEGRAMMRLVRKSACGGCHACGMKAEEQEIRFSVKNTLHAATGEWVLVELPQKNVLHAAFLAYGIPLILLIVGIALGYFVAGAVPELTLHRDMIALAAGLLLAAVQFLVMHAMEKRFKRSGKYEPAMVEILNMQEKEGE